MSRVTSSRTSRSLSRHFSALPLAIATTVAALIVFAPSRSDAQALQRFYLRGELAAGWMLNAYQNQAFGYGFVLGGAGRVGVVVADPFALQLSFGSAWFPSSRGDGQLFSIQAGAAVQPRLGTAGRLVVDANVGLGLTGGLARFGFDLGVGFEFALAPFFGLGPFIRYNHLVASGDDNPNHALFLTAGAMFSFRVPPPPPPPAVVEAPAPTDTDADGVMDPEDQCVTVPAGDHPDPARRGCPINDTDHDGVLDPDDRCVNEPAGDHPDPARRGCPAGDVDHDGVFDPDDLCPTTPQGDHPDPARRGCPDGDDDNDTVFNHDDQCPNEHQGSEPDPNRRGCPTPDRDHDAIGDSVDACPDQPGAPSSDPRRHGCPGLVRIDGGQIRIMRPVFFATRRDRILPRSTPVLLAVAEALRLMPQIRRISIEGHTDDAGDDASNMDLSRRRATSVVEFLARHAIDRSRLTSEGLGESRPLHPITGLRGLILNAARAQNRRVEFRIVDPAPTAPSAPSGSP